jgi:hypothetical protein
MKISSGFITFIAAVSLGACTAKQADQVNFPVSCTDANEKKYVQIAGYITDQGVVYCSSTGERVECSFTITETPGSSNALRVTIVQGTGANSVEKLSGAYTRENIKIRDNSGNLVKIGDQAKFTGTINPMPDGGICILSVDKIET